VLRPDIFVCLTDRLPAVIIRPSNESTVQPGDQVSCSLDHDATSAGNYTWIDSATGNVVHCGAELTISPCPHRSCIETDDDDEMTSSCLSNSTDGLLMLECHVTIGMTTVRAAVVLYVNQSQQTCGSTTHYSTTTNS